MNAAPDGYMIEQLLDHAGWVPIATLLALPRMQRLCHPQVAAVAHVLQHSPKLEVSTDRAYVRATVQPLRSTLSRCSWAMLTSCSTATCRI